MAAPKAQPRTHPDSGGFDVTAIIGRVEFSTIGDIDAVEAAFSLIGRHRAAGEYHFPSENGGEWVVTVDVNEPPPYDPIDNQ